MEVVGAVASLIAITTLAKDIVSLGKTLKLSLDQIPWNRAKLRELSVSIAKYLELLESLITERHSDLEATHLRQSLTSLKNDLQLALHKCEKLLKPQSRFGKLGKGFLAWRDASDIEAEIASIDKKIGDCYKLFWTSATVRIELSLEESAKYAEGFRNEVYERLDRVEEHIKYRIKEADENPSKAKYLLGVQHMDRGGMKSAIHQASLALNDDSISSLETQYLRTMVKTLTEAVKNTPHTTTETPYLSFLPDSPERSAYRTHFGRTGDTSDKRQDAVMETLRILHMLRSTPAISSAEVVHGLDNLSRSLLDIGMYEDAKETYLQLVLLCRNGWEDGTEATSNLQLALGLIGVSVCSKQLGKSELSLRSVEEAIVILRRLCLTRPDVYSHDLALALNNAANYLKDLGRCTAALEMAQEAVSIRRLLAQDFPDIYKPDLTSSLLTVSSCLSRAGFAHESLIVNEEAVEISRVLAEQKPELFTPHLAASLHNYANRLLAVERYKDAAGIINQALEIRRNLSQQRPEVFDVGYARSLIASATINRHCDLPFEDYSDMVVKALDILRKLVQERPGLHNSALAESLITFARSLCSEGRKEDASRFAKEAMSIYYTLNLEEPAVYKHHLEQAMDLLVLCGLGERSTAQLPTRIQSPDRKRPEKYVFSDTTMLNHVTSSRFVQSHRRS